MAPLHPACSISWLRWLVAVTSFWVASVSLAPHAAAQPYDCTSSDPAMWPPPSKPYFMLAIDTSGSMTTSVVAANSCGYAPNDRNAHSRCAMKNTVTAFGGEVNFGLATFSVLQQGCSGACYSNCGYFCFQEEINTRGFCLGCGPRPGNASTASGAMIRVPMQQHNFWPPPPPSASNVSQLISWADNNCNGDLELFAVGNTPLNGMLRDMKRYFQTGWTAPDGSVSFPTPLSSNDLTGTGVNGSTGCRSVNVILQTDGDETCDTQPDAVAAAQDLYQNGVTVGGKTFKIRVFVINFQGGNQANTDAIASAGGTGTSYFAQNEVQLSQAFANIIASAIKPEVCNNTDDNCNGCVDEGYKHYCNVQAQAGLCCTWSTPAQRTTCLNNYLASINPANPNGNLLLLPCTTVAQSTDPNLWLCYDPKETCDNLDNNCQSGVDEGFNKCGSPLHCPMTEVCDGEDNDCDGLINEGGVCACGPCNPTPEVCDGCDNDCDGVADDGIAAIPCGLANPPNCAGSLSCTAPQAVPCPGACVPGGFGTCSNNPQVETCDSIDNDCDGTPDDGVLPVPCVPPGTPGGLIYGGTSQCMMGSQPCNGTCQGFVGPSPEVCDGIDNDCNGVVDDAAFGVGQPCGINQPPCTPGLTACVNGALVCQGGSGPQSEVCDGIDNNCNGQVDEFPLADGPAAGQNGCWNNPGNCCQYPPAPAAPDVTWCPPMGATCNDVGTLLPPCAKGTLACVGGAWACQNANAPSVEVCDGIDNDCNGQIDENLGSPVGDICGSDVGECQTGTIVCAAGVLDCAGDIPPSPEICDGLDNDCEGTIDNGLSAGGPCTVPYDTMAYPGNRSFAPCQPGILVCNGMGGQTCVGGVAPNPEVCDGIDNDCDGMVDETGPPPDGIDGTANPFPPPNANLGDSCGIITGLCSQGTYQCLNGLFTCVGGVSPQPEECDCNDNDCDGTIDNQTPNGPPICSAGKDCVVSDNTCQCAAPCGGGELPCPPGQKCVTVTSSETGQVLGDYCVIDVNALCGDCTTKTVTDAGGNILCAPANTPLPNCGKAPVCVCKGQSGCQEPCFGVVCGGGQICTNFGPNAGTCVPDNCYNSPCVGCDKACHLGACVDNPCTPTSCAPDEVCKPTPDFMSFTCLPSCANVNCPAGQVCKDGACVPSCDPPCPTGEVCDLIQMPPACVTDQCASNPCPMGGCCDPFTGVCGDCPCEGVLCPAGQQCSDGQCIGGSTGNGGAGGAGGNPTAGGAGDNKIYGNPTGGGGCRCEIGLQTSLSHPASWLLGLLAYIVARRRQARRSTRRSTREEVA